MRLPIVVMATGLALGACGQRAEPRVEGAWVRLPAVPGRPAAAYFTIQGGSAPATLLSLRTPAAIRAELHESMGGGGHGAMTMRPLRQVAVPANTKVTFAPAGRHVMLFDVNPALKPGAKTTLTLAFADGSTIEAPAAVRGAGDPAP